MRLSESGIHGQTGRFAHKSPAPTNEEAPLGPWPDMVMARSFLGHLASLPGANGQLLLHSTLNASALAAWLINQELGPLAYHRCRSICPGLAMHLLVDTFSATAENTLHFNKLARIREAFQAKCIPMVLLKGAALAQSAYSDMASRTMSDIDIWLREQDIPRAVKVMEALGFSTCGKDDRPPALQMLSKGEIRFYKEEWGRGLVELHWSPFPGWWLQRTAAIDNEVIWSRVEPLATGQEVYQLSAEDMVIQVAVHQAVNHQFGLAAVRGLIDIALTTQTRPVDWVVVVGRAIEWRVGAAVWTVLNLLHHIIGLSEMEPALARLRPSRLRQKLLQRFISPESVLAGDDMRSSRARYLLLLLLVDRPRDMLYLLFRTLWPEREWLIARYQGKGNRWRHLWRVLRHGQI